MAAEQGHARAQTNLAWLYQNGIGVPQDDREAADWYGLAATLRKAKAQTNNG